MTNSTARWLERSRRKRADRLAALEEEMDRRMPTRYGRRRPRRVLAGAGAVTLGLLWVDAAVSWIIAPSDTAMIVNFVVLGVLLLVGLPLATQLVALTRGLTAKRERELDERQLTARLRAFATAHRASTAVIAAVLLVTMVADRDGRESQIPGAALFLILFALLVTHIFLPLIVATWQMTDPPIEDEDQP
ncbi:hypothetical protein E1287_41960 [Actinomadura sp. KC06]|uniref:hypothetical protein n=1 Tax=Actinomadura sp. KC06 TaxID=2530369 RepID=UPI00104EE076|nr:hypothetical protein [Actinomadura sp. KC06]TDD15766.1 hypothetical protein E1287_41960 [Actinomadura sp. KC06]